MPSGVVSGHQPTFMESTTTEGAPVAEGPRLPEEANAIDDTRKNDRDRSTLNSGNRLRVHFPGV